MRRGGRARLAALLGVAATSFAGAALAASPERVSFPGPGGLTLQGELYRPAGGGRHPAVVALHGCGGLYDRGGGLNARHADWGERLSADGYVVLLPDSFGSRGLGSQCQQASREVSPRRDRSADAAAAKDFLQSRPDVRADQVSLLGWSNGGSTVLYAAGSDATSGAGPDFARAVAFYPGCRVPHDRGWRDRVPLLILVGGADTWTGAGPCQELAAEARARGEPVDIVVYPDAVHDFDHPHLPMRERRGLAYTLNRDGTAQVGTDPAARADALRRVPQFLRDGR